MQQHHEKTQLSHIHILRIGVAKIKVRLENGIIATSQLLSNPLLLA